MATLTNTKIKDTYDGLLKTTDNDVIGASEKVITDGLGNASVLSIGTASASFSSDIEVNTLTIGKGANDVSTNTALGYQTLENATGGGNTAVGYASLLADTTGVQNTAVGVSALGDNTTGSYNTALGSITLDVNTEGNHNVAVGYRSLAFNTTGQKNVAVGSEALSTQTIGSFSTAVGYEALMSQTTGSNNTAIGYASMRTTTTGTYNTAIGVASLYDNTEGSNNVAIGRYALTNSISGYANIGIGTNSGNQLTTGSNNIYIGGSAVGSAANNDNEIVIGTSATGNGSNTATYGNASITEHHFTAGQVNVSGNLVVDTDTLFVDSVNHRVGIGLTDPPDLLSLQAIGGDNFISINADTATPATLGLRLSASINTAINGAEVSYDVGNELFQIKTGNTSFTNRLTIDRDSGKVDVLNDFAVDTNTLYVDAANNRVGVGTSSPAYSLEVYDGVDRVIRAGSTFVSIDSTGSASSPALVFEGDTDTGLYRAANNTLAITTGGSEAMRIDSAGNVGIGTSSVPLQASNRIVHFVNGTDSAISGIQYGGTNNYYMQVNSTAAYLWNTANTSLIFGANNTERMRIDSSGRVGIGTNSPQENLHVYDSTANVVATFESGDPNVYISFKDSDTPGYDDVFIGADDRDFVVHTGAGAERMRIDSSGNVGIGSVAIGTFPNTILDVAAEAPTLTLRDSRTGGTWTAGTQLGKLDFYTSDATGIGAHSIASISVVSGGASSASPDGELVFSTGAYNTAATERMRITSSGYVLIGKDSTALADAGTIISDFGRIILTTNNNVEPLILNRQDSSGSVAEFRRTNAVVGSISVTGSSTYYNTSSDYRLKENVVEMTGALDRVDALKPSRFNFIADPEKTVDGFLAHEVQAIVPEAVTGEKDAVDEEGNPIYQGIDQSKIVPLLVGAIKELSAKVAALESQLNA